MPSKLEQAVKVAKSGDKKAAYRLLTQVIKVDPKSKDAEKAWILLSIVLNDPVKKRKCLEAALSLNPNNPDAKSRLAQLDSPERIFKSTSSRQEPMETGVSTTKSCPYCAETIKAEAIVCRFCGRNLADSRLHVEEPTEQPQASDSIGQDIKDIGKTTTGVAFGILSAPFILILLVVLIGGICCFGFYFLPELAGTLESPSQPVQSTLPATYTRVETAGISGAIPVTQIEMMSYFERNHDLAWRERPRHTDGTYHWAGLSLIDEQKLVLWSESDNENDLKEIAYSFAFGGDDYEEEIERGNDGLFDTLSLVFPHWEGKTDWVVNAYDQNLQTDQEEFYTQVDGLQIYLDMGREVTTGNSIIILTISEATP